MSSESRLAGENIRLLEQGEEVLSGLGRERYLESPTVGMGTVGQHLRHCLDVYRCFLEGLPEGRVDYDRRRREESIENDPERGLEVLGEVRRDLARLPSEVEGEPVEVAPGTVGGADQPSTLGRELLFLASHTVHHWALIATLLRLQDVEPGPEFGVAPSTLEHRRTSAAG